MSKEKKVKIKINDTEFIIQIPKWKKRSKKRTKDKTIKIKR